MNASAGKSETYFRQHSRRKEEELQSPERQSLSPQQAA